MSDSKYWDNKWAERSRYPEPSDLVQSIPNEGIAGKKVLEIGPGKGRDIPYLLEKNPAEITCLDFAGKTLKKIKEEFPTVKVIESDIQNTDLQNEGSWDIIYANQSLHYFDNQTLVTILKSIFDSLQPGGKLCIRVKSTDDALYGAGEKVGINMFKNGHTRRFFTQEKIEELLQKTGFQDNKVVKTTHTFQNREVQCIDSISQK